MRKIVSMTLVLLFSVLSILAQDKVVTGKVTDSKDGSPLSGVSISVKGTNLGTSTDANGIFKVSVPASAKVLVISSVNYETVELSLGSRTNLNIAMTSASKAMDEVVVVAYGTVKKEALTGSVSKIKGSEIATRPLANVAAALVGAAPGVQTSAVNGQPGSAPAVRIRGFGSISSSNDPLYVVDGVPFSGNIANLNPNDIEDMTILKDAASTALYGARAANGVIMITTRKGKKGAKPALTFSLNKGTSDRAIPEYERVNVYDYYPVMWEAYRNSLVYRTTSPLTVAAASAQATTDIKGLLGYNPFNVANNAIVGTDGKLNPNAQLIYKPEDLNWENAIKRLGQRTDANMTIAGGQDKSDYFISLGYLNEKGYVIRSDFRRITGRINVNSQATNWLKVGLNISGTTTKSNQASSTGSTAYVNPFNFTRSVGPIYPVYAYDPVNLGSYLYDAAGKIRYDYGNLTSLGLPSRAAGGSPGRHIVEETNLNQENFIRNFWTARTYADVNLMKHLKFTTNVSLDITNRTDLSYGNKVVGDAAPSGSISKQMQYVSNYNWNQLLNYSNSFGDHNIDALLGHENYQYQTDYLFANRTSQIVSGIYELINFSSPGSSSSTADKYNVEGYFSRLNYNYDNKYFLGFSARRDGSSKFASAVRWGNFWSGSAAWRIDKEDFMKNLKFISNLKLRSSYGQTGNDGGISYYAFQPLFSLGFNNAFEPGIIQGSLGNSNLQWEASKQTDLGLEFGLFKNRINGSVEVFKRVSDNLIFDVPLPFSSGTTSQTRNVGSMYNKGIELSLDGDVVRSNGFVWNVTVNFTKIKNEITKLPQSEIISGTKKLKVGQSIYDYWLRTYRGVDSANGNAWYTAANGTLAGSKVLAAGDTVTTNQNNAAYAYQGSAIPDFYGSVQSLFSYKGFEVSTLVTFQKGGKVYDATYAGLMHPGNNYGAAIHVDALKSWHKPGDITNIPRLDVAQSGISNAASSRWLTDASFVNIRNITFAYTYFPKSEALGFKSVRFNVTGENLQIFTKRLGMNVEESFSGVTSNAYIPSRIVSAGINVNF